MTIKFDLELAFLNQVLAAIQEAAMPSRITNPLLNEFSRQMNDKRIQSLAYPAPDAPELKVVETIKD